MANVEDSLPPADALYQLADGLVQQHARVLPLVVRNADTLLPLQRQVELRLQLELKLAAVVSFEDVRCNE